MPDPAPAPASASLEGGAYEIIRQRLETHGADLRKRLTQLNDDRQKVFGTIETSLIATERVTTRHNCVPRDLIAIGTNRFLFGYNVHLGLKSTTELSDVLGAYDYDPENHTFHEVAVEEVLASSAFSDDFEYLYKYYKQTVFVKFLRIGPHVYMAFRIGNEVKDIKTFKWLADDSGLTYVGNRFDHEYAFPPQQEFEWKRAHRDMHRGGLHPHISIEDRLFVETVGGDLTIKIEDNTDTGEGIYAEEVSNHDQTLDDAEIFYAILGNLILLKIRPYQEPRFRYLIYNEKVKSVHRADAIEDSCVLLPDEHGIIFSNGFHLQNGETKIFESALTKMLFERRYASPNGEDYQYVFYNRLSGDYILMSYNLISQSVETPIICNGYSTFPNGELIYFKAELQPQKHHALQIWQTPYVDADYRSPAKSDHYLYKLGNADIVRCMAECHEALNLLNKDDTYADLYVDLARITGDIIDSYFWLDRPEASKLKEPLRNLHAAAQAAIDEFDKVIRIRQHTEEAIVAVERKAGELLNRTRNAVPNQVPDFVHLLAELRSVRGETISLRDLRYADEARISTLEQQLEQNTERLSQQCVEFLLKEESLAPYQEKVAHQNAALDSVTKAVDAREIGKSLDQIGHELELLIDIVSNLKIEDATQTTQIIDSISDIYATLNQGRAELKTLLQSLGRDEGSAQFHAEVKLLNQAIANHLSLCDTPAKCDDSLGRVMVQLEELEAKVIEFDDFVAELADKRSEIYDAFESRKVSLLETRHKRANHLQHSAERILAGIKNRLAAFKDINAINTFLSSDLMIDKVRDLIAQLQEIEDPVKADSIQTQLKTLREDAVRQLKDRQELYVAGENVIKLGRHPFSVNTQPLELSIVPREDALWYYLAGTNYFQRIDDEIIDNSRSIWNQELVSENQDVYRGEYLTFQLFKALHEKGQPSLGEFRALKAKEQKEHVRQFMSLRYAEGYTRGVHDKDAMTLLSTLLKIHEGIGLLRYSPGARALGLLFWYQWTDSVEKSRLSHKLHSFGDIRKAFPENNTQLHYITELQDHIRPFAQSLSLFRIQIDLASAAGEYLFHELCDGDSFTVSPEAAEFLDAFQLYITTHVLEPKFKDACAEVEEDVLSRFEILYDWLRAFQSEVHREPRHEAYLIEAAAHLLRGGTKAEEIVQVFIEKDLKLSGSHPRIKDGQYRFHYNEFVDRLAGYDAEVVPLYQQFIHRKVELTNRERERLRLAEFKPRVMSAFVRNRLLDQVYLPLIGDNLAKQMGTAGTNTRTDRMGLLLLVSPPGYGKTTLMEYVADRLGVTFIKINGPAIGHKVTSLDPVEAPNASAREEVNKLNLALEMGDNIMIYVDDIQHCNPEFLQKFISLCDGQRRMEGVYNGVARTYDLRGRKVAVVMAGNPYTESGGKFQIPDMLANRADTYNLGDIVGSHAGAFEDSYLENCLTSNPGLSPLASRSQKDVYAIMRIASTQSRDGIDFEGNYRTEEIEEMVLVMQKLMRVRDTILRVNLEYIRSAAQQDDYRTEPPFKLQGSYRNMNRIAEKVRALMTDEEVNALIMTHYENESQTLTTGAEANLLKFKELEGCLSEAESKRWNEIKRTFQRNLLTGGSDQDPIGRVVGQLSGFTDGLGRIESVLSDALRSKENGHALSEKTVEHLEKLIAGLRAVPVNVEIKVVPVEHGEKSEHDLPVHVKSKTEQQG